MLRPASFAAQPTDESAADHYLCDLATIFAAAILRLKSHRRLSEKISSELSESTGQGLEFGATTRLNGRRG